MQSVELIYKDDFKFYMKMHELRRLAGWYDYVGSLVRLQFYMLTQFPIRF